MDNIIAWVYGPSAAGKETFIHHLVDKQPGEILARLGWADKKLIECKESIEWVVQDDNDGNEEKRRQLPEVITECSGNQNKAVILVKGQDLDLRYGSLTKVKESLPDDDHVIIFLFSNMEELHERMKGKKWWNEALNMETCRDWAKHQIDALKELIEAGFPIVALDSGKDRAYPGTTFPPVI